MSSPINILPEGGEVFYYPSVFDHSISNKFLDELLAKVAWKQEPIRMFGKEIMQPRLTAWYGDPGKSYTYSGITMKANDWIEPLIAIKAVSDRYSGVNSTSALINLYRDGNDYMGWHRDNEKMLGKTPVIASVSFGEKRVFQLRRYRSKKQVVSIELEPGSILVMKGESQQHWEHRLPKQRGQVARRINITFRVIQ